MTPAELDAIEARAFALCGGPASVDTLHALEVDVPALIAEVRRLQAIEAGYQKVADTVHNSVGPTAKAIRDALIKK